jgi:hypothetical protein
MPRTRHVLEQVESQTLASYAQFSGDTRILQVGLRRAA